MTAKPPFNSTTRRVLKEVLSSDWNRDGQPSAVESPRSFSTARATALLCLLLCGSLSGCTLCQNVKRTIVDEPTEFSWMGDRKRSVEAYRQWAEQAWNENRSSDPEQCDSDAYAVGFKDGFVDYVYAGGSGEPPPVAPRQFWNVGVRSTHGHASASDWFAGYRHGAQVAEVDGYRKRALVPSSMFMQTPKSSNQEYQPRFIEQSLGPISEDGLQPEPLPPAHPATELQPEQPQLELPVVDAPASEVPSYNPIENEVLSPPTTDSADIELTPPQLPQSNSPEPAQPTAPAPQPSSEVDDIFDAPAPDFGSTTNQTPSSYKAQPLQTGAQQARAAFASAIRTQRLPRLAAPSAPANRTWISHSGISQARHESSSTTRATRAMPAVEHTTEKEPRRAKAITRSDEKAAEMFRRMSR